MAEQLPSAPGTGLVRPSEFASKRPPRHRVNMHATVHPDTLDRLDGLASKFETHRGQVIDKLVSILDTAYKAQKLYCIHGQVCQIGRTDLPSIL